MNMFNRFMYGILVFAWSAIFTAHAGPCHSKVAPVTAAQQLQVLNSPRSSEPRFDAQLPTEQTIPSQHTQSDRETAPQDSIGSNQSEQAINSPQSDANHLPLEIQQEEPSVLQPTTSPAPLDQKPRVLAPLTIYTEKFYPTAKLRNLPTRDQELTWFRICTELAQERRDERAEIKKTQQPIPPHIAILSVYTNYQTLASPQTKTSASSSTPTMSLWERRHQSKK
jgi:hypothetical protein